MEYAAVLLFALAVAMAYRHLWRRVRAGVPPVACDVESVQPGWVELRGRVRAASALRSPLTGNLVVGYDVEVDQERGITAWDTVIERKRFADFELEDETGRILVRASSSNVALDTRAQRGAGGPFRVVPARVVSLLQCGGRPVVGVLFARAFRWRERTVVAGQRVRVRAWAAEAESLAPGADPLVRRGGYRGLPYRLVLRGSLDRPLQVLPDD